MILISIVRLMYKINQDKSTIATLKVNPHCNRFSIFFWRKHYINILIVHKDTLVVSANNDLVLKLSSTVYTIQLFSLGSFDIHLCSCY